MFDFERSITDWRRQMVAAGIKTPVPLEELENHLRDDVNQQMRLGLDAQQAFETAVQRIGQVSALQSEFKEAGGEIRTWQLRRIALISAAFVSVGLAAVLLSGLSRAKRRAYINEAKTVPSLGSSSLLASVTATTDALEIAKRIKLLEFKLEAARLGEAVKQLEEAGKQYDPNHKGVLFYLMTLSKTKSDEKITLTLKNVTLAEAAERVCQKIGDYELVVYKGAVWDSGYLFLQPKREVVNRPNAI